MWHRTIGAVVNETINISEKIERDIEEDYVELGQIYLGDAIYAKKINFIEKGKTCFEENREKLYQFLCIENQICEKIKKMEKHDVHTLFSTVGGLLIGSSNHESVNSSSYFNYSTHPNTLQYITIDARYTNPR